MPANNLPVQFNSVMANIGEAWNASLSSAIIPVKGIYYISIVGTTPNKGGVEITLTVNGLDQFATKHRIGSTNMAQTKEQADILKLNVADKLSVVANIVGANSGYTGTTLQLTSFFGILLSAEA